MSWEQMEAVAAPGVRVSGDVMRPWAATRAVPQRRTATDFMMNMKVMNIMRKLN
jgi:hypothetical protein